MAVDTAVTGSSLTFGYGCLNFCFLYIKHRRRRVIDFPNDFESLRIEVAQLLSRWNDIKVEINRNSVSIERNQQFTTLENKVNMMLDKYEMIVDKYSSLAGAELAGNYSLRGEEVPGGVTQTERITNLPNLWSCKFFKLARLDKDVVKLIPEVESVRREIKIEDVTRPRNPEFVLEMPAEELGNVVPSHQERLEKLQGCILEADCKRIEIWGDAGVGKSNILKHLNNWLGTFPPSRKLYGIWVTVPTNLSTNEEIIRHIQDVILYRLNETGQNSGSWNAHTISRALCEKSYVLLFDGFSPSILLEEIGIFEHHEHGKVIIENKFRNQLTRVKFNESIKVPSLPMEDSRTLFDKIIDDQTFCNEHRVLRDLILKELGGFPGVIEFMAGKLKINKNVIYWEGQKQRLKAYVPDPKLLALAGLKPAFEIAYGDLEENGQKCLLYAALFPEGFTIPKNILVECWKAEEFIWCPLGTFNQARMQGESVLNDLTKLHLLENCSDQLVKMPINFRRVARHTPFPEEGDGTSFVRSGPEIDGHLKDEEWEKARRVSLMKSKLVKLPMSPKCEDISTLLLQLNPYLIFIQEPFFRGMQKLRVLDLHNTGIMLLPPSISYLTALRSLYLNNCGSLEELPPEIVNLKELEVLDIRGTKILCFPKEIGSLVSLRCLRFSFVPPAFNPYQKPKFWGKTIRFQGSPTTRNWLIFSPETVGKLDKLEELTIVLLISTGSGEEIEAQIRTEVGQFKNVKDRVNLICRCSSQSQDQRNLVQRNEDEINLQNPSIPDNAVHALVPGVQSTRSNDEASRKRKGKGLVVSKPKNRAHGGGVIIRDTPETNASRFEENDEFLDQQVKAVELPNFLAEASTSGTADKADSLIEE